MVVGLRWLLRGPLRSGRLCDSRLDAFYHGLLVPEWRMGVQEMETVLS